MVVQIRSFDGKTERFLSEQRCAMATTRYETVQNDHVPVVTAEGQSLGGV